MPQGGKEGQYLEWYKGKKHPQEPGTNSAGPAVCFALLEGALSTKASPHNGHSTDIELTDRLHTHDLAPNLVSISHIAQKGFTVKFSENVVSFITPMGTSFMSVSASVARDLASKAWARGRCLADVPPKRTTETPTTSISLWEFPWSSPKYWAEVAAPAIYLQNVLQSSHHPEKNPYKLFSGQRPDISHLRAFGCVGYMKIPIVHTDEKLVLGPKDMDVGRQAGRNIVRVRALCQD
ncbi:hypothetical protein FIBSPDRAFT_887247 [Athelia psychrophila]|uniref:Uncharacterized protein n=1 Tax=Athelia psychrophila TaxID=1759441 RepID=A0A166PU44_9AGAM|nr:hypothetical protein FIBSPDRAFT_887247 [Fibularhizoctonia sp. CBS 109695]